MNIGRKIYFLISAGNVILDTGERVGHVIETTFEQDFESYVELAERIPETVGVLKLEYGQYTEDFTKSNGFRVNPTTLELEFSYSDPREPEKSPVYQMPLTEQMNKYTDYLVELDYHLSLVELGLN